jgi:hypothetical protein
MFRERDEGFTYAPTLTSEKGRVTLTWDHSDNMYYVFVHGEDENPRAYRNILDSIIGAKAAADHLLDSFSQVDMEKFIDFRVGHPHAA